MKINYYNYVQVIRMLEGQNDFRLMIFVCLYCICDNYEINYENSMECVKEVGKVVNAAIPRKEPAPLDRLAR